MVREEDIVPVQVSRMRQARRPREQDDSGAAPDSARRHQPRRLGSRSLLRPCRWSCCSPRASASPLRAPGNLHRTRRQPRRSRTRIPPRRACRTGGPGPTRIHRRALAHRRHASVDARVRERRIADRRDRARGAYERAAVLAPQLRRQGLHCDRGSSVLRAQRRRCHQRDWCAEGPIHRPPHARSQHHHAAARRQHASRCDQSTRHESRSQAPRAGRRARNGATLHQGSDPRGLSQLHPVRARLVRHRCSRTPLLRHAGRTADARAGRHAGGASALSALLRSDPASRPCATAARSGAARDGATRTDLGGGGERRPARAAGDGTHDDHQSGPLFRRRRSRGSAARRRSRSTMAATASTRRWTPGSSVRRSSL